MQALPCITLNRYAQDRAKKRHPWVFSNEVGDSKQFARLEPGSLVDVLDCHGGYLGTGYVNPKSLIAVRILSRERGEAIDAAFFHTRLERALRIRDRLYGLGTSSMGTYRAVFGEGDGLPGLVIDRYQGAWVLEPHSFGMQQRLGMVTEALSTMAKQLCGEKDPVIVARTDNRSAQLEGMQVEAKVLTGDLKEAWAVEDGIRFPVDPLKGQKTGFFFDQRDNRAFFSRWVKGAGSQTTVLDAFCHSGAWGLRALKAGAARAVFVDSSASALAGVKAAAKAMGCEAKIECIEDDALSALQALPKNSFGAVALDPPALVPNRKAAPAGIKAYRELNRAALELVAPGGALSSSSCSYHLLTTKFEEILQAALGDAGRSASVLHRGAMSADHPVLPAMEEGRYLKNLFLAL